ncbi:hypothetical protein Chor_015252, partial [Crotalus horridus]
RQLHPPGSPRSLAPGSARQLGACAERQSGPGEAGARGGVQAAAGGGPGGGGGGHSAAAPCRFRGCSAPPPGRMAAAESGAGPEKLLAPALVGFFVYNPRLGPREGEEEKKILFYYPNEAEKNEKIRNVGLCEAIVQFTRTFSPTKPAKSLHTQKNRQFFNEPEENFWMVMVVQNPVIEKHKDGKKNVEYQEEELLDKVYTSVLQQCYNMYKLAGRDSPMHREISGNLQHYGRFLTGPLNLNDPEAKCRFPKIFVNTDDAYEELHLIVYKAMSAAVCFMIDASVQPTLDFCRRLDSLVGPQLTVLASDICEQYNLKKRTSGSEKDPQFKFIYFNHMNLAEKSTIHMRTSNISFPSVHPDLMKILGDINNDFTR